LAVPTDLLTQPTIVAGSAALGCGVALLVYTLATMATRALPPPAKPWEVDALRAEKLRAGSWAVRWCEPMVEELAGAKWLCSEREEANIDNDLAVANLPLPWAPRTFLSSILVEGFVVAGAISSIGFVAGFLPAWIVLGCIVGITWYLMSHQSLKTRAAVRKRQIKARLPFAVDLMALMVESGADFPEAVETLVNEIGQDAISRELAFVAQNIRAGRSTEESLTALVDRLRDQDVKDFVDAVLRGEKLGVEISSTLRSQADEMLLKRVQRIEEASAQAQVHMVYPGFLIMLACLLLVMAPVGLLMQKELLSQ
jgi:tight adherence protein C